VRALLPKIEGALAPFRARPHWGKVFLHSPDQIERLYPRIADYRDLAGQLDPTGKFHNDFLQRLVLKRTP
jgi:xylitol oxidase